jgi:hypothetical protein
VSITAPAVAAPPDERPTLEKLLETLGTDIVEVVATPHGIDVPVTEPVIYDSTEQLAIVPGATSVLVLTNVQTASVHALVNPALGGFTGAAGVTVIV